MGTRQVQVKPESQPVGQGSDQEGGWPHPSMVQLETAVMSLRQELRTLGAHGQEMGGARGGYSPARSIGGTSYTCCASTFLVWRQFVMQTSP